MCIIVHDEKLFKARAELTGLPFDALNLALVVLDINICQYMLNLAQGPLYFDCNPNATFLSVAQ